MKHNTDKCCDPDNTSLLQQRSRKYHCRARTQHQPKRKVKFVEEHLCLSKLSAIDLTEMSRISCWPNWKHPGCKDGAYFFHLGFDCKKVCNLQLDRAHAVDCKCCAKDATLVQATGPFEQHSHDLFQQTKEGQVNMNVNVISRLQRYC
jgi:hypothetical protein